MRIDGPRLDPLSAQALSVGATVEALPVGSEAPDLFPGQRLTATVLEFNGRQALIDLQGAQATLLTALPGLKPGNELFVKVAQVAPKLLLEVAPGQSKSSAALLPLAVGQEVNAEVVEQLPGGALLLNLQGALLEAETPEPLPAGTVFSARVEQLRPQVVLHLLPEEAHGEAPEELSHLQAEAARLVRTTLTHGSASAESLQALTQELTSFVEHPPQDGLPPSISKLQTLIKTFLPEHAPPTAEHLAALVRDGGLQYEAKLLHALTESAQGFSAVAESDLKGLLLQVLQDLEASAAQKEPTGEPAHSPPRDVDSHPSDVKMTRASVAILREEEIQGSQLSSQELVSTITHHLEHIESQQAVNLLAQVKGEPYQLQIPFFTGQGMTTAHLSIEADTNHAGGKEEGKKGKRGETYNVLFFLDLDGFGQTRIDARVGEKSLWVAFYVDQPSTIALLQEALPAFRETLQSLGYEDVLIAAKPLKQLPPEKREKFTALTVGIPASLHLLDVKA